jgi:hypothetical protein
MSTIELHHYSSVIISEIGHETKIRGGYRLVLSRDDAYFYGSIVFPESHVVVVVGLIKDDISVEEQVATNWGRLYHAYYRCQFDDVIYRICSSQVLGWDDLRLAYRPGNGFLGLRDDEHGVSLEYNQANDIWMMSYSIYGQTYLKKPPPEAIFYQLASILDYAEAMSLCTSNWSRECMRLSYELVREDDFDDFDTRCVLKEIFYDLYRLRPLNPSSFHSLKELDRRSRVMTMVRVPGSLTKPCRR